MVVKYGDVVVNDTKVLFICHSSMERVELAHYTATVQTLEGDFKGVVLLNVQESLTNLIASPNRVVPSNITPTGFPRSS